MQAAGACRGAARLSCARAVRGYQGLLRPWYPFAVMTNFATRGLGLLIENKGYARLTHRELKARAFTE